MQKQKDFLVHRSRSMKKKAPYNEAISFLLADFIADKLLPNRDYALFKPEKYFMRFSGKRNQLFLTTLP